MGLYGGRRWAGSEGQRKALRVSQAQISPPLNRFSALQVCRTSGEVTSPRSGLRLAEEGAVGAGGVLRRSRRCLEDELGFTAGIPRCGGGRRADGCSSHIFPPTSTPPLCAAPPQSPCGQGGRGTMAQTRKRPGRGRPPARVRMPRGCAQHRSANTSTGVKCHTLQGSHRQHLLHMGHWCHPQWHCHCRGPSAWVGWVCPRTESGRSAVQSFPLDPRSLPGPAGACQVPALLPSTTELPRTSDMCTQPLPAPAVLGIKARVKSQPRGDLLLPVTPTLRHYLRAL